MHLSALIKGWDQTEQYLHSECVGIECQGCVAVVGPTCDG
jgi:hypothetical protein